METINDKIYFESDAEFEDFCIAPYATIEQAASGPYVEGDYSEMYKKCLAEGKTFVIKDEDSVVYKRKCVSKRVPVQMDGKLLERDTLVQLDVENLEDWFEIKFQVRHFIRKNPQASLTQIKDALSVSENVVGEIIKTLRRD